MLRAVAVWVTVGLILSSPGLAQESPANSSTGVNATDDSEYSDDERSHWSLLPRATPAIPQFQAFKDQAWIRNPIDAFVLEKLRAHDLDPSVGADRLTLIRRLTFDLLGLPPTPDQIEEFIHDTTPDAYERLVDRLLTSPHYGERWAQHWLDISRFAETEGFEYDRHLAHAWRYRDYVIQSFQNDLPFDQFVREQLAGDELDTAGADSSDSITGSGMSPRAEAAKVAVGFLRFGPIRRNAGNPDVAFSRNEVLTEMTDTVGVTFLATTVGCARCHDHKFDPIRQKDYYRFQAYFAAVFENEISLTDAMTEAAWKAESDKVTAQAKKIESELDKVTGDARIALQRQLKEIERQLPPPLPAIASVVNDQQKQTAIHVLKRGDATKPQEVVGPRPLGVLVPGDTTELPATVDSPKSRLANWIIDPANPLTARVIVNRIWQRHFGQGLVRTANDFGLNGEHPSHPALLDYLANEFIAGGWRIKSLHRLILTSNTYRQVSTAANTLRGLQVDPSNRLLWRFPRLRLDAEQIRDAMLAVSGRLNTQPGGPSVIVPVDTELVELLYKPSQWMVTENRSEHLRRSVYLIKKRNLRLPFLEVFDQPTLQASCPQREASTHAPQALELLNGTLSNELAVAFAQRLTRDVGNDQTRQVERAFQLTIGRHPARQERELASCFLQSQPLSEFALAMFNLNEFLYVK